MGKYEDDLLSAYLDRELSPEERAEADRRLRESAGAREQFDDLCWVSQTLRSLPRVELGDGFAAQVMERMGDDAGVVQLKKRQDPRGRNWRLAYALVAVLACIAVVFAVGHWRRPVEHRAGDPLAGASHPAGPSHAGWDHEDILKMAFKVDSRQVALDKLDKLFVLNQIQYYDSGLDASGSGPVTAIEMDVDDLELVWQIESELASGSVPGQRPGEPGEVTPPHVSRPTSEARIVPARDSLESIEKMIAHGNWRQRMKRWGSGEDQAPGRISVLLYIWERAAP